MKFKRLTRKVSQSVKFLLLSITLPVAASNIYIADQYFEEEKYQPAMVEYLLEAEQGSARAYYQLGAMYYLGLGTDKNIKQALMWFSLASEHYYGNAKEIIVRLHSEL
ncbi:MAG: hypothetical protein OQK03_14320, partial [Colwellia sp.]|nr:hypothetical protein [Colwellia sp.]